MCRFVVYFGDPIVMFDLLLAPEHGLIGQSNRPLRFIPSVSRQRHYDPAEAQQRNHLINGDGCGVGFYQDHSNCPGKGGLVCVLRKCSGVFKTMCPAWNSSNLLSLSHAIKSSLFFGHVRATGHPPSVAEQNCHPFTRGRFLFMHNGDVGGFRHIRRQLASTLCQSVYNLIEGSTDTEHVFAMFLQNVLKLKADSMDNVEPQSWCSMKVHELQALLCVVELTSAEMQATLLKTMRELLEILVEAKVEKGSSLNLAVSDGSSVVVTRFRNHTVEDAPSLYVAHGTQFVTTNKNCADNISPSSSPFLPSNTTKPRMLHGRSVEKDTVIIASEPITFFKEDWKLVCKNVCVTIGKESGKKKVSITPIEFPPHLLLTKRTMSRPQSLRQLFPPTSPRPLLLPAQMELEAEEKENEEKEEEESGMLDVE